VAMKPFKPIKQMRVSEEVAEQLKQSILSGQMKAGDKLPTERDLAEGFEVSRLAVREALRSLQGAGFVVARQGSGGGVFVTDLTFEQLSNAYLDLFIADKISIPELLELRLLVEPRVAYSAAKQISPHYAELLKDALALEDLPIASLSEDVERKTRVHLILAEMCGNRFFEGLVRSIMKLARRVTEVVDPDPQNMHPKGMHDAVVAAVISGDSEVASAAMHQHLVEFGKNLVEMEKVFREGRGLSARSG
jgi:GntR family transcriptional regulator, transcriptional repressor for pyruvate dehydrogenase complex